MKVLCGIGYVQKLSRAMSKLSNFAISFPIICINSVAQAIDISRH
jgi:hypothetical protein